MKQVREERYLGCQLAPTVGESITATVKRRLAIASRTIYETRTVMEDSRAEVLGSIAISFKIWNSSVIPMVLYGSETWGEVPKKTIKALDNLSLQHL